MIIRTIAEVIGGRELFSVVPDATLADACHKMKDADIGALVVLDAGRLVGILSERDVIRRGVCAGLPMDTTKVAEVMTADPVTVDHGDSLATAMETMVDGGFRHVPVMYAGGVAGMLSMRDIPTEYRLMCERFREAQTGPSVNERRVSA